MVDKDGGVVGSFLILEGDCVGGVLDCVMVSGEEIPEGLLWCGVSTLDRYGDVGCGLGSGGRSVGVGVFLGGVLLVGGLAAPGIALPLISSSMSCMTSEVGGAVGGFGAIAEVWAVFLAFEGPVVVRVAGALEGAVFLAFERPFVACVACVVGAREAIVLLAVEGLAVA